MSSFDAPRGLTRSNSLSVDPWASSLPPSSHSHPAPPPAIPSAFTSPPPQYDSPADPAPLDYSVIDEEDRSRPTLEDEEQAAWQLPRQHRLSVVMKHELEGFILKHNVWIVISENGTSVERRYSDFTWLIDALTRRYPFRLLPSLPPKRLQMNGHYMAADDLFLERRRRGLERALTALVHHPVVRRDGILAAFLAEQGDLAQWRKTHLLTLTEEPPLIPSTSPPLPSDLDSRLSSLRTRLPSILDSWTRLSTTLDRLAHRRLNQGAEFRKLRDGIEASLGAEREGWRPRGVEDAESERSAVAGTVGQVAETEEASARREIDGVVEDFKRHREIYLNLRDLFLRQQTLGVDNVDKLRKRVSTLTAKLHALHTASPLASNAAQQSEQLQAQIAADEKAIEAGLRRREWVRWVGWEEVRWAFRLTSLLALTLRDYAAEETTFARQLVVQWSALGEGLGAAPLAAGGANGAA
ncbi:hypothetical protein JCM10207_001153 [Rhodosporidiobolus poonsookiae]